VGWFHKREITERETERATETEIETERERGGVGDIRTVSVFVPAFIVFCYSIIISRARDPPPYQSNNQCEDRRTDH
jgi:hypothetical protein